MAAAVEPEDSDSREESLTALKNIYYIWFCFYLFIFHSWRGSWWCHQPSVWIDSVCGCVWADIALIKESVSFVVDTGGRSSGAVNAVWPSAAAALQWASLRLCVCVCQSRAKSRQRLSMSGNKKPHLHYDIHSHTRTHWYGPAQTTGNIWTSAVKPYKHDTSVRKHRCK